MIFFCTFEVVDTTAKGSSFPFSFPLPSPSFSSMLKGLKKEMANTVGEVRKETRTEQKKGVHQAYSVMECVQGGMKCFFIYIYTKKLTLCQKKECFFFDNAGDSFLQKEEDALHCVCLCPNTKMSKSKWPYCVNCIIARPYGMCSPKGRVAGEWVRVSVCVCVCV